MDAGQPLQWKGPDVLFDVKSLGFHTCLNHIDKRAVFLATADAKILHHFVRMMPQTLTLAPSSNTVIAEGAGLWVCQVWMSYVYIYIYVKAVQDFFCQP